MIKSTEYNMLEQYIAGGVVEVFRTKKEVQAYATSKGWPQHDIVRVERRFEIVWVVAQHFVGREQVGTCLFDVYLVLTNKIDLSDGVEKYITVKVKKLVK